MTVFEQVKIAKSDAEMAGLIKNQVLVIPSSQGAQSSPMYYIKYESKNIREENPRVFRSRTTIVRGKDKNILAEMIGYTRVGGDFPTFAHPSTTACPDADQALRDFRTAVLIKDEK